MKNLFKGLITAVISLLLIAYVGYHIFKGTGAAYTTEIALNTTYTDALPVTCWFVRTEEALRTEQEGALLYAAAEGEKIAKNGVVAQIFAAESSIMVSEELSDVRTEIKNLEALSAQALAGTKPSTVTEKIAGQMTQMMRMVNQGRLTAAAVERERLLLYFSQKQIITGELTDFSVKIAELQAKEADLLARYQSPVGVVSAPAAGYFSSGTDGYEQVLTPDGLASYTAQSLRELTAQPDSGRVVGKLVKSNIWYAACIVTAEQARSFSVGTRISILLPDTGVREQVEVSRINSNGISGDAVVVFMGSNMDETLVSVRGGTVQLELQRYTGLQINRSAVHMETLTRTTTDEKGDKHTENVEVQGVYVIYGEQIKFREVSPVYWGDTFVICDLSASSTASAPMLKQYDQVIIGGKDLYDGKSII